MANMTVDAAPVSTVTDARKPSRLRKVTFTHTAAGTAAGSVATSFPITGELLYAKVTQCDAAWDFLLTDGSTTIYSITGLNTANAGTAIPLYMISAAATDKAGVVTDDDSNFVHGIPMVNEYLTCTTANVSTVAPTITVYWRESD
jgi:hypothetical protein